MDGDAEAAEREENHSEEAPAQASVADEIPAPPPAAESVAQARETVANVQVSHPEADSEQHRFHEHETRRPMHKHVDWRTLISLDHAAGKSGVAARIRDISMSDAYLECQWNFLEKKPLLIVFSLPPKDPWSEPEIVRVTARILSDVLSHDKFCYVMHFVEFHGNSREILSRYFANQADSGALSLDT